MGLVPEIKMDWIGLDWKGQEGEEEEGRMRHTFFISLPVSHPNMESWYFFGGYKDVHVLIKNT